MATNAHPSIHPLEYTTVGPTLEAKTRIPDTTAKQPGMEKFEKLSTGKGEKREPDKPAYEKKRVTMRQLSARNYGSSKISSK